MLRTQRDVDVFHTLSELSRLPVNTVPWCESAHNECTGWLCPLSVVVSVYGSWYANPTGGADREIQKATGSA